MLNLGQKNKLTVKRITAQGFYLADEEANEVLLPNKYIPDGLRVGDSIDVFIYKDSEDRIIATNLEPLIKLNEFAFLHVKQVSAIGAFLDWGLEKDLFVPFREQNAKMMEDGNYVVYLYLDTQTERLTGSNKINKFLSNENLELRTGDEVNLLVFGKTELGYKVIINSKHEGLIYHNEIFQPIKLGDSLKGFVKTIRDDNKVDIALQKQGFHNMDVNVQKIVAYMKDHNGQIHLTDDSAPEEIAEVLNMSKKVFKKSIGILYKKQLVNIQPDGVYLN